MDENGDASQRARIRSRVASSRALMTRARARSRQNELRAHAGFENAEALLNHAARALPAVYRFSDLAAAGGDLPAYVREAAHSVYHRSEWISVVAVDAGSAAPPTTRTLAATGRAEELDEAQRTCGEGPGLDAIDLDQVAVLTVPDLAADEAYRSWPRFAVLATDLGARSAVSVALPWRRFRGPGQPADRLVVGAINLYATQAHVFGEPEATGLLLGAWVAAELSGRDPAEIYDAVLWRPGRVPAF